MFCVRVEFTAEIYIVTSAYVEMTLTELIYCCKKMPPCKDSKFHTIYCESCCTVIIFFGCF